MLDCTVLYYLINVISLNTNHINCLWKLLPHEGSGLLECDAATLSIGPSMSWSTETLILNTVCPFHTSENTHLAKQYHILKEWNTQLHSSENLKARIP